MAGARGVPVMEKQMKSEQQQPQQQHKKMMGTSNVEYDLFSEVHCLLKGNAALEKYMDDAREAGDRDVETCFKAIHEQNKHNVDKLRELIAKHIVKPS
jgi:uncharacterized membrane protein YheB (UPF0754 family)